MEQKCLEEKLQIARLALKQEDIKKSGKNTFRNTTYYTLDDLQPAVTKVASENRFTPTFSFSKETATLKLYDWDSEKTLEFNSPMMQIFETEKDKNGNEKEKDNVMQQLGSYETYQRRYLLQIAFDITDEDKEQGDNIDSHDIMVIKQRIELKMTDLMKKGYDIPEVVKAVGLKDEKQYIAYLSVCGTLNKVEKNMKVLLGRKKETDK